jgi:hypothetical protein
LQSGLLGCAISKIAGPGPAPARKRGVPYSSIGMLTASRGSAAVMRLPGNEMEKMNGGRPIPPPDLANAQWIIRKHDYRQRSCYVNRQSGRHCEWHFGKSKVRIFQPANQRTQTKCDEDMPRLN